MTKTTPDFSLPDFRNLGILMRLILAAQGLGLVAALLAASRPVDTLAIFLGGAAYLQPPLLLTLLLLFLIGPWLARSPPGQGTVVAVLAAAASTVLWRLILEVQYPDAAAGSLARSALLAVLMALALLACMTGARAGFPRPCRRRVCRRCRRASARISCSTASTACSR